ncbi:histidine kinase [soil metagenome]
MNKKYYNILIHLTGWIAFFIFPFVLLNFPGNSNEQLHREIRPPNGQPSRLVFFMINNVVIIIIFYLNLLYLLPQFFYKQKKITYFIAMAALLLLAVYLPSFIRQELLPTQNFNIRESNFGEGRGRMHFNSMDRPFGFFRFLITWFLSSIISLAQRYRKSEQRNKEMKVQKLNAELSYLKAQINPHFLFNTLNNIYSLSILESKQTPEAILKLSAIMRYVTQDAEAEKVPLDKELDYLQNYIDLQQLRSNNHLTINFTITGDIENKVIAPLLLINFIENAFKHGISNHLRCFVTCNIDILQNNLIMDVTNKKMNSLPLEHKTTGSNNTKRRLQLQYPDKHVLTIDESNDEYKIKLTLDLT